MALRDFWNRYGPTYASQNPQGSSLLGANNQTGLLSNLGNINPNLLVGANVAGLGFKGQEPFGTIMPSLMQMAQFKKAFAPTGFRQLTIKEKKDANLPLDKQFQMDLSTKKISQIGGSGVTVNVGDQVKSRIAATKEEKESLGYQSADNVVLTKDAEGNILADDLRSSVDTRMKNIGAAVEKSKLLEADDALRELENYIAFLQTEGVTNLPGIGIVGGRTGPLSSKEGKKLRALLAAYENITLKKRSGAAVTPSELTRVQNELAGAAKTSSEEIFLDILRTNRKILERQKNATFSIHRKEDVAAYQDAGGLSLYDSPLVIEDTTTTVVSPDLSNLSNQELLIEYYKLKNKR